MLQRNALSLLLAGVLGLAAIPSQAGIIAYTSFEEPGSGDIYTDTGDPSVDHALMNNPGEAPVNYTSVGGEMGFSSYYFNTRNDVGLTDGDFVGVTSFTGTVGAYTDGLFGFELQDADGTMQVSFDEVDTDGLGPINLSIDVFIQETGWESDDNIRIWVELGSGDEIDLLNTIGTDIDDLLIEGAWMTLALDNVGPTDGIRLFAALESNSGSESLYLDNIVFSTAVPVPAAFLLLGSALAGLGFGGARRRRSES